MKTQENTSEGRQIKIQNVLSKWNSLFAMAVEYTTTLKGLQIWFYHIKYSKFVSKLILIISHWIPDKESNKTHNANQTLPFVSVPNW